MRTLSELLPDLFPRGHDISQESHVIYGEGQTEHGVIHVIGTTNHTDLGVEQAICLAREVLNFTKKHPSRPILLLVDTNGQKLAHLDELLGINGYFAHLVECLECARSRGAALVSLVYGEAVSGGFLSFGLMADQIYSLEGTEIRVMNLEAMARITKLPLKKLESMSLHSPVFAPGVENYIAMGGVHGLWTGDLSQCLAKSLQQESPLDQRSELGLDRGGRKLSQLTISKVLSAKTY